MPLTASTQARYAQVTITKIFRLCQEVTLRSKFSSIGFNKSRTKAQRAESRVALALRENLKRRKKQERIRRVEKSRFGSGENKEQPH